MVFIIFGVRRRPYTIGGFNLDCTICRARTVHAGIIEKRVAHIFFIPILALGSKKYFLCNTCSCKTTAGSFPERYDVDIQPVGPPPPVYPLKGDDSYLPPPPVD